MTTDQRQRAANWLRSAAFPPFPFELRRGVTVTGEAFREALLRDLELHCGPRERHGALQNDLRDLARVCGYRKEERTAA